MADTELHVEHDHATGRWRRLLTVVPLLTIRFYQVAVRPHLFGACRHWPTCSDYALEAYHRHGLMRGTWLTGRRLCRCHPWSRGGPDPVP